MPAAVLAGARRIADLPAARSAAAGSTRCGRSASTSPSSCSTRPASRPGSSLAVALPGARRHRQRVPRHHARGVRDAVHGAAPPPCAPQQRSAAAATVGAASSACCRSPEALARHHRAARVPGRTCLSYCEFYELWQSGFVAFRNGDPGRRRRRRRSRSASRAARTSCGLQFPEGQQEQDLPNLLVFVRLWRKLRDSRCGGYSFAQLRDICDVLQLYTGGALNPDFVRQLAAFQMLRDDFGMDSPIPTTTAAARRDRRRPHAPARAVGGPGRGAVAMGRRQLIARSRTARAAPAPAASRAPPEFVKLLARNLDPLSRLAGFDPASATDSWHALPTHTLRFAEVLAKVYASDFSVGELLFLFTARPAPRRRRPVPAAGGNEALDSPLGLPDDDRRDGAVAAAPRHARRSTVSDEEERGVAVAAHRVGPADGVRVRGERRSWHSASTSFPDVLAQSGQQVSPALGAASSTRSPPRAPRRRCGTTRRTGRSATTPRRRAAVRTRAAHRPGRHRQADACPRPERGRAAGRAGPVLPPRAPCWRGFALLFADFAHRPAPADRGAGRGGPLRVLPAPVPAVPPPLRR